MTWTGAIVLFAVLFFVVLFILLPRGLETQEEQGEVVKGTPRSAPAQVNMGRKFLWAAIFSAALVGLGALVLEYELIALDDLSFMMPSGLRNDSAGQ